MTRNTTDAQPAKTPRQNRIVKASNGNSRTKNGAVLQAIAAAATSATPRPARDVVSGITQIPGELAETGTVNLLMPDFVTCRQAVFARFSPSFCSTTSRMMNFWTLPVTVIGNSATNSM